MRSVQYEMRFAFKISNVHVYVYVQYTAKCIICGDLEVSLMVKGSELACVAPSPLFRFSLIE